MRRSSPPFLPAIRDGRLDFAIGTLSDEMKLQDLHVEPLFESEFVLVANRARIGNGTVRLASLQHEQWVLPETQYGLLQRTADHPAAQRYPP
ncbi:DNA-binding transcriptional activator TdcA [Klebsiella pneumoniae]|uniref:DNA-binding transcriptional activator TdcA n=1 Tax=Klebsiella pneumoniae TaxID=573 RepID=A0A378AXH6_KLEPN|nr:DNA-binding transcriptional activator TdcA [Klebsiella pneumoniae]